MEAPIHYHDVIIIGGGLTGLRAAVACSTAGLDVAILSKTHPLRSHSVAAQGGVNAALSNNKSHGEDSWESHAFDTVKGSDYLADQDAVLRLCEEAPRAVLEMEHWGTVFSRDEDGRIAQRPFGGAGFPRTCYAADRTGHNLLHTLYEKALALKVRFCEERFVTSLVRDRERCLGCTALDLSTGDLEGFVSKATLLATGGYGRIYARSTNAHINTGDGAWLALKAGVALKDMEFVQFHPTTLFGTNILITEGARGEGGTLSNGKGERFMARYSAKAMELAPRDIVARSIQTEIDEGRGVGNEFVNLDLTHLGRERISERLPGIREIAMDFAGVDPVTKPIPVQPGQHYSMGGVDVGSDCRTSLPRLFAAGECACVSVHGANRLGGNSLLETLVFGKLAGEEMVSDARGQPATEAGTIDNALISERGRIERIRARESVANQFAIRASLKKMMTDRFGIFRSAEAMLEGARALKGLKASAESVGVEDGDRAFNQALVSLLELQGMLTVAESVAQASIWREESRGSHFRKDHPKRDDERFLVHSLATLEGADLKLGTKKVRLGRFPVEERRY